MKKLISLLCALALIAGCMGDLSLIVNAADAGGSSRAASGSVTYYVSIADGRGGNNGRSETKPFPGLDAVPWDQLLPGDRVLLKAGETFPGSIRLVDIHGTADDPITIGTYGTGAAPVVEARGQGIWLPETGNDNGGTPGKYVSSGIALYDCSYVTVSGLTIVNVPDAMKSSFICEDGTDRSGDKMTYSGIGVAADSVGAAAGITLTNITVRGNSELVAVKTDISTTINTTGVTTGAAASARTFTNASGTYYVSSLNGSDSNDGTTPEKAFYSLHKINELNLQPGAKVYLERGSVFENQYLHVNGGGADGNPVVIDAYGTGNTPVINTNGNGVWYQNYRKNLDNAGHMVHGYVSSCILLYDVPYIEVKNIGMTNFGRYGETEGADFANLGSYDGGTVPGETGYAGSGNGAGNKVGCYQWGGKMTRTGVAGVAQNMGTVTHTVLQNLDIENIYGNIVYKHMNNGGIYFTAARALNANTGIPRYDDLRIEGCYLKHVSRWGIAAVHTAYWSELSPNGQQAIPDSRCQQYGATNVYIGHNYLEEVGGDPITAMHAYEPFVEYNVAYNGGREMSSSSTSPARYINGTYPNNYAGDVSAGIWPWKCKTALFEHNECYTMLYSHLGGNNDAQPWDADSGDSTIYQYNYSAGNTGGCIMFCAGDAYNTVFRYNISYKDGMPWDQSNPQNNSTRRGILDPSSCPNGQIYNNTFVVAEGTPVYHYTTGSPVKVENNIFYNLGNEYAPQGGWNAASGPRFVQNIYVGFAQTGDGSYTAKDTTPITLAKNVPLFAGDVTTAPTAPKSTSKNGVRLVNGVRDWTHDWSTEFNMFKLDAAQTRAVNTGLPHNYDCLTQDSDFGVPRVTYGKDFYGNPLDGFHDIGAHDTGTADPEGVTVISVGHESATVRWSAVAGAASYKVALDDGEPVAADTLSSHTFSGLFPLAEYTVSVTAYDASGDPVGAARTATFTTTRPAAPADSNAIHPTAVKAGSEETAQGEGKENAIDGSSGTIWHTNWSGSSAADRWIAIDLGRIQAVNSFKYLPRQDGGDGGANGVITEYEIYLSSTDTDWQNPGAAGSWTKAKEGTWASNKEWKTVTFDAGTTARYVKLKCVEGVGGFASAAEISVSGVSCTGITLQNATVPVGKTVTLEAEATPAGSALNNIVWTSSDRTVATVDANGVVTGLKEGTTTITAHLLNDTTASCTVTVTPRELSDACELVSSLFEVRDTDKLQVPFTANKPTTVAELKAGLTVSEDATVKVIVSDGRELSASDIVSAGMTVRIVAENETAHKDYTIVQKNAYNSFNDWTIANSQHQQGNVWFAQYRRSDTFSNWESSRWNTGGWYSDDSNGYASAEQVGACDDIRAVASKTYQGSGFTFRAPVDGMVEISFPTQPVFRRAGCVNNQFRTYLMIYKNGAAIENQRYELPKSTTPGVTIAPFTLSVSQGDTIEFMVVNEGSTSSSGAQGGVAFTPAVTYQDEAYAPDPTSVTVTPSSATIYTNTTETAERKHTVQLSASVEPAEAVQTVTWESLNTAVATVSQTGLVTAVGNGTTTIRAIAATSTGQEIIGACAITVGTRIESITVKQGGASISGRPVKVYVNEGDSAHPNSVTLTAEPTPANPSHPALNWNRPEGAQGMISIVRNNDNGTSATITAITDELGVGEITVRVASAEHSDVYTEFPVQVIRFLENDVHITGDAKIGSTLEASTVDLVMKDAAKAALSYQWYHDSVAEGNKIDGATHKQYVVDAEDAGHKLVVAVTADETTFYEGTRTAVTDEAVALADGPDAPTVGAVDCTSGDNGQITGLDAGTVYEYKLADAQQWTAVPEHSTSIDNLPAGNYQVRIAATSTTAASDAATATILPKGATGYHDITVGVIEHGRIIPSATKAREDDEFTLTVIPETGYRLTEDSLSLTYTDGSGSSQPLTADADGKYTMPDADVAVTAAFEKLTFTITHELEHVTCTLPGEHTHTVEYGDMPVITLNANEGYTMPANMQVFYIDGNGQRQPFYGYTYSHAAATPDRAVLTFTSGITANLVVTAEIPVKTFAVNYTLTNGLSAPEEDENGDTAAARTVEYKAAYTGTLVAEHPEQYTLPLGIQIKMGGVNFTEFDYDSETGTFTIAAGKITGDLAITASGVDATVPVNPVANMTLTPRYTSVVIGNTVTLTATVTAANPDEPATDPTVVWFSSDPDIAAVDDSGVVTGVAEGTATITATTVDGGIARTCEVTVSKGGRPGGPSTGGGFIPTTTTEVKTNPDGSVTTTVTNKFTGAVSETTVAADGSKVEKVTSGRKDVSITVTDKDGEVLAEVELPAQIPALDPSKKFIDVPSGHYAEGAIENMTVLGVIEGKGDRIYDPESPMKRSELAKVLYELSNGEEGYDNIFADVPDGMWYVDCIAWAAKSGVVRGVGDDAFAPEATITREELAVMLCRYARMLGLDTSAEAAALESFADGGSTHDWAVENVAWCVENGILQGKPGSILDPRANATRAQVAVMLQRFVNLFAAQ